MFSGLVRWFHQHVLPEVPAEVTTFLTPLAHDIVTAGGNGLLTAIQSAVNGAPIDKAFDVGVTEAKSYLEANGLPVLEHAVMGAVAAAVANSHAVQSIAPPPGDPATVAAVNPALVQMAASAVPA